MVRSIYFLTALRPLSGVGADQPDVLGMTIFRNSKGPAAGAVYYKYGVHTTPYIVVSAIPQPALHVLSKPTSLFNIWLRLPKAS